MNKKSTARFLVDENLPISLVDFLASKGFEAHRVSDIGLRGAKDEEIAEFAFRNHYVIITLDKDFGYIYHRLYKGQLTIVLLRPKTPTPERVIALMENVLRKIDIASYRGRLIIVAERRIRVI